MLKKIFSLVILFMLMTPCLAAKKAKLGDTVAVEYTGTLKSGAVFDTNVGSEDLKFTLGAGTMLKDFENAFIGMKKGETKTIELAAKDAYGEFNETQVVSSDASKLPAGSKVGDELTLKTTQGYFHVRVVMIEDGIAFIDGNHKLAGQDLTFVVTLKDILEVKN